MLQSKSKKQLFIGNYTLDDCILSVIHYSKFLKDKKQKLKLKLKRQITLFKFFKLNKQK